MSQESQWAAVVTLEEIRKGKEEQFETVAPCKWLSRDEKWLWWPPSLQVKSKVHCDPDVTTWKKFKVLKIKIRGDENVCQEWIEKGGTTASEMETTRLETNSKNVQSVAMPHQPTINVLGIMGRNASLSPSASRRHDSSKQNHTSSSSKSNDYDSLSRHQRSSTSSESSPNYINQKNRYGRSYRKPRCSSSRSRSRSPRNVHRVSNSRKSWSRSPRKNRDRMPKPRRSRSRSPRNIPHRLLKSRRSRSPEVRSTFQPSRDQPTYPRNTSTPNDRISSGKSVPSASTLNRHFPMEEGRFQKQVLVLLLRIVDLLENRNCHVNGEHKVQRVVVKVDTTDQFNELEESLSDENVYASLVSRLTKIGGKNVLMNVKAVMEKIFSYKVLADFNMLGKTRKDGKTKVAFGKKRICDAIVASVVANHKAATEADVLNKIAGILKYAPDKIGAGGRGKTGDNDK